MTTDIYTNPADYRRTPEPTFEMDSFSATVEDACLQYEVIVSYEAYRYPDDSLHVVKITVKGVDPHESEVKNISEQVQEAIRFRESKAEFECSVQFINP